MREYLGLEQVVSLDFTEDRPTLEVGKKYRLTIFDAFHYNEPLVDEIYRDEVNIVYNGGDLLRYFWRYVKDSKKFFHTPHEEYFDEYFICVRKSNEDDEDDYQYGLTFTGLRIDYMFELYTNKFVVRVNPLTFKEGKMRLTQVALMIEEYTEPIFVEI